MHALKANRVRYRLVPAGGRFLRRARAIFSSIIIAASAWPRFIGSGLLGAFFALTVIYAVIVGGHGALTVKILTSDFGLSIEKIDMSGLVQTSEIDILEAIGFDENNAMPAFDVAFAREQILRLPWVDSVTLRKIYPNRLQIVIQERQPMALWQRQGGLDIIDHEGRMIVPFAPGFNRHLPLLVGEGAHRQGYDILQVMKKFELFQSHIRAYVRVADRRWDLVLDNGIKIRLPVQDPGQSLARMLALDEAQGVLSRDVLVIDLRLGDRMSLTLSAEAMERWQVQAKRQDREFDALRAGRG